MAKVLMIASEAVPLAKTGGLADVCGALPIALRQAGHDVSLILPAYRCVHQAGLPIDETSHVLEVPVGNRIVNGRILRTRLPDSDVPVFLVARDEYFDRPGLYGDGKEDYRDNCERFVFFCRAALEAIRELRLEVEIVHCHDWQTGLVPVYLSVEYGVARGYDHLRTVMTIHNMAYQGRFWHWDMVLTGLDWKYFNWRQLEFYGDLNLLKAGLVFADTLTTVSPRYACEIQSAPHGCGLEGLLASRRRDLHGILNGVDYELWSPASDKYLSHTYDASNWRQGKAACKSALQSEMGLNPDPAVPLLGFIGRMVEQKGIELILATMDRWARTQPVQWVLLGNGNPDYEQRLTRLAKEYPHRIAARIGFSDELAHRIEAGADIFLMPSRFEPCGLNQLFSLKYGAVPVVHRTGGLSDTITDANADSLAREEANGFDFDEYSESQFETALARACDVYSNDPKTWDQMVRTGMQQDWSWDRSGRQYAELYERTLARGTQAVGA